MKRILLLLALGVTSLFVSGCSTVTTTTTSRPVHMVRADGLTIGDLLVMINSGRNSDDIIAEVRAKGLRATPSAADLDVLQQAGASREVIEAVNVAGQQFPTAVATGPAVVSNSTTYYSGYGWWPWVGFSYWSGYPYGYAYGPGYYYRGPVYRPPTAIIRPPVYGAPSRGWGGSGFSSPAPSGSGGGFRPSIPRPSFGRR